ncbi:MAG: tRNA adenosine(34) deaminase TadA [Pseudohongiellaceae bacterium]
MNRPVTNAETGQKDEYWMRQALQQAEQAAGLEEVPVGAVIVLNGEIIGRGYNRPVTSNDPSAHAEIASIRDAAAHQNNYRLPGSVMYVTIEPCAMCAGALIHARIARLVFGTAEPRAGAVVSRNNLLDADYNNHKVVYSGGVLQAQCETLIQDFFRSRRLAR